VYRYPFVIFVGQFLNRLGRMFRVDGISVKNTKLFFQSGKECRVINVTRQTFAINLQNLLLVQAVALQ